MARLRDIVFDCVHPAATARFWAAAMDGYSIAPYDDEELARLRALGVTDVEDDPSVLVESSRGGPRLWFQVVPEGKGCKNRVHLDLSATNREAEAERLVGWGARVRDRYADHLVLADPEANEFCIVDGDG
ncbi:VOC family protein [Streptomyces sp. NPDC102270]|uniref:VOC family protein n=1 Tax=Streptomyces sp. NPDC102270 TaxID=3366150 RepID=UPI0037FB65F8